MKINSRWGTSDRKVFKITSTKEIDNQLWVFYTNINTGQKYSCLAEAFKNRFKEIVNDR